MFHFHFERKKDKILAFNIVHFPNFEIGASPKLAPHLTVSNLISARSLIRGNAVPLLRTGRYISMLRNTKNFVFSSTDNFTYFKYLPLYF